MAIQTATNPQTGEKAVLIGGEWKPYTQSATGAGGQRAFLINGAWATVGETTTPGVIPGTLGVKAPAPVVDVPTGQKIINVVRPTVEAVGAIGGGALGAPAGPLGAVAGSGLGYGIATGGMDWLEELLGYRKPPANVTEALVKGASNVLEGASMEAGGRIAAPLIAKGAGKLLDFTKSDKLKAASLAKDALKTTSAAGSDLPDVLKALREAPPGASVDEITAKINNPTWQALISQAKARSPESVKALEAARLVGDSETLKVLSRMAGGTTAADTRGAIETARGAVNALTTPMRETALNAANLGKEVSRLESMSAELGKQAAGKVQEVRRLIQLGDLATANTRLQAIKANLPAGSTKLATEASGLTPAWARTAAPPRSQPGVAEVWGQEKTYTGKLAAKADEWATQAANASLDLGQGAKVAQDAANALRENGIKPLRTTNLIANLESLAKNPSYAGNDLTLNALKQVQDDIATWTGNGGVIDAFALDAIRKNSVNAVIARLRPGFDATAQRNAAAGVLSEIKPAIDNAIVNAGGKGYTEYLAKHHELMNKVAEKELFGEALNLWKTDKAAFVRLVQNESPDAVEKILGPGRYNIAMELADNAMQTLRGISDKHVTQELVKRQASDGQKALSELSKQHTPSVVRLPPFMNFWTTASNKVLSEIEKAIGPKSMDVLTKAMQNPKAAQELLNTLPATERIRVLNLLSNQQTWAPGASTAGLLSVGPAADAVGGAMDIIQNPKGMLSGANQ